MANPCTDGKMCAIRALLSTIKCREWRTGPPAIEHVPYSMRGSAMVHLVSARGCSILLLCSQCRVCGANPYLCQELRGKIGYNN